MAKIGEQFVQDMVDRGRRELGGVLFQGSNVAQPMYPLRGGYEVSKENESPSIDEGSILEDRLKQVDMSRDDPGRDDRNRDLDRE